MRVFKRWVTKEVLPSIRKTERYSSTLVNDDMNHKYNDSLTFKIENEVDLHTKVVSFPFTSAFSQPTDPILLNFPEVRYFLTAVVLNLFS